jgi:hypothetical protein
MDDSLANAFNFISLYIRIVHCRDSRLLLLLLLSSNLALKILFRFFGFLSINQARKGHLYIYIVLRYFHGFGFKILGSDFSHLLTPKKYFLLLFASSLL